MGTEKKKLVCLSYSGADAGISYGLKGKNVFCGFLKNRSILRFTGEAAFILFCRFSQKRSSGFYFIAIVFQIDTLKKLTAILYTFVQTYYD